MSKILIVFMLLAIKSNGQYGSITLGYSGYSNLGTGEVKSTYDTTTLYSGDASCNHSYAAEFVPPSFMSCAVYHGEAGCPNDWYNRNEICVKCLKHIHVQETRSVVTKKDPYQEALERLKQKQSE